MHDEALGGDAALPGVLDPGFHAHLDGLVEVGAGHHDERVRPAQLEHHLLDVAAGRLADAPSGALAAGERGGGDARIVEQLAGAAALDEQGLEGAFRKSGLAEDLLDGQGALRDVGGMLEQRGVPRDQPGRGEAEHLPEREVPRHHGQHNAQWLPPGVGAFRADLRRLGGLIGQQLLGVLGVVAKTLGALDRFGPG